MISDAEKQDVLWRPATLLNVEETQLTHNNKTYRIQASRIGQCPPTGYPIIYLLDGDFSLPLATLLYHTVNTHAQKGSGVLLIGVGYIADQPYDTCARAMDYLPHQSQSSTDGAEDFFQFLQATLKPMLMTRYHIDEDNQTLFGHSFGGVFALYTLFNHTSAFQHYVISSPSIWWDKQKVLADEHKLSQPPNSIKLSSAEYEENPKSQDCPARTEKKNRRKMVGNNQALFDRLRAKFPNDNIAFQIYRDEDHGSVVTKVMMEMLKQ